MLKKKHGITNWIYFKHFLQFIIPKLKMVLHQEKNLIKKKKKIYYRILFSKHLLNPYLWDLLTLSIQGWQYNCCLSFFGTHSTKNCTSFSDQIWYIRINFFEEQTCYPQKYSYTCCCDAQNVLWPCAAVARLLFPLSVRNKS